MSLVNRNPAAGPALPADAIKYDFSKRKDNLRAWVRLAASLESWVKQMTPAPPRRKGWLS